MSAPVIEETVVQNPVYDNSFLEEMFPYEEPTDKNAKAHIVNPPKNLHIWQPGMETQEMVDIARTTGQELVALCGYRWVPKSNPDKLDVCETCMHIAQQIMSEMGE